MKYSTFIVELKHKDTAFTGSLFHQDAILPTHFKKIGRDLFLASFKTQVEFRFLQNVSFKDRSKEILVLLPLSVEYNQRKLTKLTKILAVAGIKEKDIKSIILHLLGVERFVKIEDYIEFFGIEREELLSFLVEEEIQKHIKLIDVAPLIITTVESMAQYREQLHVLFTDCYTGRIQSVLLTEIAEKLNLPLTSILFRYLLRSLQENFSYKIHKDKIVFQKLALTETEKDSLTEIEKILKKNKMYVFSIDDILELSGLIYKDVNATLWFMVDSGQVVQLDEKFFIFAEDLNKVLNKLKKYKRNEGELIDIPALRELTLFSRKYVVTLFEYFDAHQITERVEKKRRILLGA